jgi:hypothetical protein
LGTSLSIYQEEALPRGALLLGVNAGEPSYTNTAGIPFQADSYYRRGESRTTNQAIPKTNDGPLNRPEGEGRSPIPSPCPMEPMRLPLNLSNPLGTPREAESSMFSSKGSELSNDWTSSRWPEKITLMTCTSWSRSPMGLWTSIFYPWPGTPRRSPSSSDPPPIQISLFLSPSI